METFLVAGTFSSDVVLSGKSMSLSTGALVEGLLAGCREMSVGLGFGYFFCYSLSVAWLLFFLV